MAREKRSKISGPGSGGRQGRRRRQAGLGLLLGVLLVTGTVRAEAPAPAQLMPLAPESLLLDMVTAGDRWVVVGERGHILVSDNDGGTWAQVPAPVSVMLTAVFFVDAEYGWAVGHDGMILATRDGGDHWQLQRNGLEARRRLDQTALSAARQALTELEADPDADPAALEEARWQLEEARRRAESPPVPMALLDVWFADRQHGWAVGAFGMVLRTTDGGDTWSVVEAIDNPRGLHVYAVTGTAAGVLLAGEQGFVRLLPDGRADEGVAPDLPWEGSLFGALADGAEAWVFGLQGRAFVSRDGGRHWRSVTTPTDRTLSGGAWCADSLMLVGHGGTVLIGERHNGETLTLHRRRPPEHLAAVLCRGGTVWLAGQGGLHRFDGSAEVTP